MKITVTTAQGTVAEQFEDGRDFRMEELNSNRDTIRRQARLFLAAEICTALVLAQIWEGKEQ